MGMPSSMGRPVTGMIDADSGPRPMTAIKGVGFTSSGNRGTVSSFVLLIHISLCLVKNQNSMGKLNLSLFWWVRYQQVKNSWSHQCGRIVIVIHTPWFSSLHPLSIIIIMTDNFGLFTEIAVCKFLLGLVVVWPETFLCCPLYVFIHLSASFLYMAHCALDFARNRAIEMSIIIHDVDEWIADHGVYFLLSLTMHVFPW